MAHAQTWADLGSKQDIAIPSWETLPAYFGVWRDYFLAVCSIYATSQ